MSQRPSTPLLDRIASPADLRALPETSLRQVADELRLDLIDAVSRTGGHLGAGLGVVELTVAIHAVFDTPADRLIWDVGHQAYPHKILTGRREAMRTVRQEGGVSGFAKRTESEYDRSAPAILDLDLRRSRHGGRRRDGRAPQQRRRGDRRWRDDRRHGLRGDEQRGALDARLIVILNDNDMSIAPPTGALSAYLARLVSGKTYRTLRNRAKTVTSHLPEFVRGVRARPRNTRAAS